MARIYNKASEQLVRELAALEDRLAQREAEGKPLADAALAMRDRLESLITQTGVQLRDLSQDGVDIVSNAQRDGMNIANEQTEDLLYAATGDRNAAELAIRFDRLPTETIEAFVGLSSDGSPLAVLFDDIAQAVPDALRFTLSSGLAQGRNPRAVARDMMTLATLPRRRAETIARTEMLRASREAQRRLYEASPAVTGYERVATQDARVCLACLALSGTFHKTSEILPSHPNCRCVMVPKTPSLAEITGDPSIPDLRPSSVTSEDIIKGLTKDELIGIMGPKRFQLWREGTPLVNMVGVVENPKWGPTTKILPLKDIGPSAGPGTSPKPGPSPKPPRKPRTPKPKAPEAPKIEETLKRNRDPQWLLEEFRKIAPDRSKLNEILDKMKPHLDLLAESKALLAADSKDRGAMMNYRDALFEIELLRKQFRQASATSSTPEQLEKMRALLRSNNPMKVNLVETNQEEIDRMKVGEFPLKPAQETKVKQLLNQILEFVDDRKLELSGKKVPVRDVRIMDVKGGGYGYYEASENSYHRIGLNLKELKDNAIDASDRFEFGNLSSTLAHEFTHWVDGRNANQSNAFKEFFKRRTIGDIAAPSPYGGKYKPDQWPDAYCGNLYPSFDDGIEIHTRGMQFILNDPIGFAEMDFDYFSHVVKNVLGAQG